MAIDLEKLRGALASTSGDVFAISRSSLAAVEREISELRAANALQGANRTVASVCERMLAQ